ncbi:hypothetical protein [Bradyrhizobium sp. Ash2021]|uniref:hypothetical protein n=1 Tax=Bradyrhizobium sp. Ash2021 TaxID=2954771 RepID=UPI00281531A1|nr:hypothetical protein [Bradyrhizobium sp. Ash2021]WMT71138.1 hypothetical protein NL528_23855 [Bradyrhizobium sp. Ash2021]
MNEFKKAISETQAEKDAKEKNKEQHATERQEQLQKWTADVRSWEKQVYYPILKDTDEALKDIGGQTQSMNAQPGVYNVTVQARGNGQTIIFKIALDGTLGTVTHGGYGGNELGKISDPDTTARFKELLVGAVKKAAS